MRDFRSALSLLLPQHVFSTPDIEARCRTAPQLFLALDYDGTLVPIAPRPEEARPTPALLVLLSQLAQTPRVKVAVVSGRLLAELCALLPVQGISHVGTHGLEMRTATGETRRPIPAGASTTVMARLRRDVESIVTGHPGVLLEDKQLTLALHYRLAQPEGEEQVVAQFLSVVQKYQRKGVALEVIRGKKVVEVRPVGANKGKAVRFLLAQENTATLPLYLGDDTTDEDAFQALEGLGLTILVADPPRRTAARYYLKNPEEVFCFLACVLNLRQAAEQVG